MMVLCNNCQVMMIPTMSFSHNGNKKYCRCPRCYSETKKQRLDKNELSFGEYLNKAVKNRGITMNETQKDELIYEYHKNNMAKLIRLCQPMLIKMGGISRKDYEDFYEIASDVVMSSVNTYDDSKSSFHTYITGNITRKFKTELRDRNRKKRIPAKQLISIHMETDDGLSLEDTIPSKFDIYKELYGENISDIRIRNYLNRLSNKQREIVSLLAQGYQSKEIKDLLHMNNKEYLENISIIQAYENIRELKRNVD